MGESPRAWETFRSGGDGGTGDAGVPAPAITSRWSMDIEQALAGQGISVLLCEELKRED